MEKVPENLKQSCEEKIYEFMEHIYKKKFT